jgi:pSer/pThr/pTyr-binding forkhead associated (FHA) protein
MDVSLVLFKKGGERKTFVLPGKRALIGRGTDCNFKIPLLSISRRHCELTIEENTLHLHDLGSRNGTFVNGMRIVNAMLRPGDFIRIGQILFGIQVDGRPDTLVPPDFVLIEENEEEHPGDGSTIIQPPQSEQTHDGSHDIADDIFFRLDEEEPKNGRPEKGPKS